MKCSANGLFLLPLVALGCAQAALAQNGPTTMPTAINITRSGSQPSQRGPAEYFTGTVRVDPLFKANDPSRTSGGRVTVEPGARAACHPHPLGQPLIVTAGVGRVQEWGKPVLEIRAGDVIWIPPG